MQLHATPEEASRLAKLRELMVLDSEPEPLFDTLSRLASEVCGVPIALVSLIDAERQWFKANVGLPGVIETPRDIAFCDHTIRQDGLFEVGDATLDRRFADNPLVTGSPQIRFYAGAPLILSGGDRVGTLCVIDRQQRRLTPQQAATLKQLARAVVQALEMRQDLIHRSFAVRDAHEQGVAESEARLRAILDSQSELVSQATPEGRLIYVNPAYAAHFDRSVESIVGTNLYDYVEPADRPLVRERVERVLGSGATLSSENRMLLADGEERWIAWTNTRQIDSDGHALLHSTGRDVTARVLAERELRTSRAFLARTGRVAGVGGWSLELSSGVVTWSEETRRIHEVPPDFRPSLDTALDFYAPESRPLIERAVQMGMASGTPWDLELQVVTAKGRHIWARAVGAVEFEHGRPVRLVGAFQDITERHRLQDQVAQNERFLRQMSDSVPVRIAYLDRERRYRFVNQTWCRSTGLTREDVLGKTRAEVLPGQDDETLWQRAARVLAGQAQHFEFNEVIAGQARRFEHRLTPDVDAQGQVQGFFVSGVDVTERSAAEKATREIAAIFEHTTDYVVQTDRHGQILYMNPSARRVAGLAPAEPVGQLAFERFLPPQTLRLYEEQILPALAHDDVWLGQSTVCLTGRDAVPVSHMVIAHRDPAGQIERYSALMRDESEAVAARQEIQRQSAVLESVANAIPSTVAVMDNSGHYRFVNRAFEQLAGRASAEIIGRGVREILGEEEFARRRPWIDQVLRGDTVSFELDHDSAHGTVYTALDYIPLRRPTGEVDGFVVITQDVTQRKREELRLQMLSQTDALTGLLNRAGFKQRLENLLGEQVDESLAILYVDLDRFKPVNDTHGHAAGDELLKQVARRLTRLVRPSDAVARLGGDEFAILLRGMSELHQAERVGGQIVEAAREPFALSSGVTVRIGASVGGAVGKAVRSNWPKLLEKADRMLYRAKNAGRNRFAIEGWHDAGD